jgi:hypothetical protein
MSPAERLGLDGEPRHVGEVPHRGDLLRGARRRGSARWRWRR